MRGSHPACKQHSGHMAWCVPSTSDCCLAAVMMLRLRMALGRSTRRAQCFVCPLGQGRLVQQAGDGCGQLLIQCCSYAFICCFISLFSVTQSAEHTQRAVCALLTSFCSDDSGFESPARFWQQACAWRRRGAGALLAADTLHFLPAGCPSCGTAVANVFCFVT